MAVPVQTPLDSSVANGATSVFPYSFLIFDEADLQVTLDDAVAVLNVDYTVDGVGSTSGGNVTFISGNPANGTTVVRRRMMAYKRDIDYQFQGDFLSAEVNPDQDAPVMMIQQLDVGLQQSIKIPESLLGVADTVLPAPLALGTWRWNGASNAVEFYYPDAFAAPSGSDQVGFLQSGSGAVARTSQDKMRDTKSVKDFGAVGDGITNDTAAIQAALSAATAGVYFPAGTYLFSGNLTIADKPMTMHGDGSGLSILRQITTGGIVYTASASFNFGMPSLNIRGIGLHAGAANCGNAVTMTLTGGSGYAGVGPVWEDVEIVPAVAGFYWTKGVRGTSVRNARFARVVVGSNAITGQTTHGFHLDGNDDPVEIWFDDFCYIYVLQQAILIEGQYEGIYLNGINFTSCRDGLLWNSTSPNPVLHVMNCYLNVQRVAIDCDLISYFKIQTNSFSSSGLSTGDFVGVQIRRTSGNQTQAGIIAGNTMVGGNGYTEYGVRIVSGNSISVYGNTFYNMATPAITFQAGSGLREYDNTFPGCAAPQVVKPAGISSANSFPEVLLRANSNSTTQAVPHTVTTKLNFPAAPNDNWSYFNTGTSRWTPPAGAYQISAAAYFTTNVAVGDVLNLSIQKNGSTECINASYTGKAGELFGNLSCIVMANGTDYFEIFANIEGAGADRMKAATNALNYWHAHSVG